VKQLAANITFGPRLTFKMNASPALRTEFPLAGEDYAALADLAYVASDLHGLFLTILLWRTGPPAQK
jgi:hypothetical protein